MKEVKIMSNIVTTIRIDEDLLEKVKAYSEIENKSQTDFINGLLTESFKNYLLQRHGGAVLTLPNPQIYSIDQDKAEKALEIVEDAFRQLRGMNINYQIPFYNILSFFEQRIFYELPEDVEKFKQNMIIDGTCTHSEGIAEDTK